MCVSFDFVQILRADVHLSETNGVGPTIRLLAISVSLPAQYCTLSLLSVEAARRIIIIYIGGKAGVILECDNQGRYRRREELRRSYQCKRSVPCACRDFYLLYFSAIAL